MSDSTRRTFIVAAGATAATGALGTTFVSAPAQAATGAATAPNAPASGGVEERVVAHVPDHRSDVVVFHSGDREVVVHDRDLVTTLLRAAGGR